MSPRRPTRDDPRQGLLGLYALALMARAGPVHGYRISERIAERTDGAWRPGPGAVYPALQRLTRRGLARARKAGRRRVYSITPEGRRTIAHIRARYAAGASRRADVATLWAEVAGVEDVGSFLLLRLRRALDAVDALLWSEVPSGPATATVRTLRADVVAELEARLPRLKRGAAVAEMASMGNVSPAGGSGG